MNKKAISETIVSATKDLLQQRGYNDTGIADIIKSANITEKEFLDCFKTKDECCLKVIKSYAQEFKQRRLDMEQHDNARQRLSLYVDSFYENADTLIEQGHPILNLYYDLRSFDNELSKAVISIIKDQYNWIDEQFIIMFKAESGVDQGDRLKAALSGLILVGGIQSDAAMFRNQLNQLKSWIRSM